MKPYEYRDLYDLMDHDFEAEELFYSLPDYVRGSIDEKADRICTEEELQRYVEEVYRDRY